MASSLLLYSIKIKIRKGGDIMKLILVILSVFSASFAAQAASSPGAYDKLRNMFDAAVAPAKIIAKRVEY